MFLTPFYVSVLGSFWLWENCFASPQLWTKKCTLQLLNFCAHWHFPKSHASRRIFFVGSELKGRLIVTFKEEELPASIRVPWHVSVLSLCWLMYDQGVALNKNSRRGNNDVSTFIYGTCYMLWHRDISIAFFAREIVLFSSCVNWQWSYNKLCRSS